MTILFLPAFFWYAEFGGLKQSTHGYYNSIMMLGNMGFNRAVCISDYVQLDKVRDIGCNVTGTMSQLKTYGLLPNSTSADNADFYYGYCGDVADMQSNGYADNNDAEVCTNTYVDSTALTSWFNTNCYNTTGCSIDFPSFLKDVKLNNGTNSCTTNPARFYIQYTCAENDSELNQKRSYGLLISCIACFACLVFMIVIYYEKRMNGLEFQQWDINNLTASDFTVEWTITDNIWNVFNLQLSQHALLPPGNSAPNHVGASLPVCTFEAYIEHYFTKKLNQLPKINEDVEIRVANITFGFDNPELISLLQERGALIAKGKFSKVPAINEKIDKIAKDKKAQLIRPVAAFITFERQEGRDRAIFYFKDPKNKVDIEVEGEDQARRNADMEIASRVDKTALGEDIYVTQAPEPSDILWENRRTTWKQIKVHEFIVLIVSIIFLVLMFYGVVYIKALEVTNMFRYPATTDCDAIDNIFIGSAGLYEEYAKID